MAVVRFEPFRDFVSLRDAMNNLLEDSFVRPGRIGGDGWSRIPVDVHQTDNELVVKAALPGVRPEDVSLSVLDGVLTMKAESKPEAPRQKAEYLRQEIVRGVFERSFELPFRVQADKAQAHFEHGILTVTLPKADEAKPKQIKINVNGAAIEGEKVSR